MIGVNTFVRVGSGPNTGTSGFVDYIDVVGRRVLIRSEDRGRSMLHWEPWEFVSNFHDGTKLVEIDAQHDERIALWAHLASEHSAINALDASLEELEDLHQHEHNGPGGIRNHDESSRAYKLRRVGEVLSELDDFDAFDGVDRQDDAEESG